MNTIISLISKVLLLPLLKHLVDKLIDWFAKEQVKQKKVKEIKKAVAKRVIEIWGEKDAQKRAKLINDYLSSQSI